MKEPEVSCNLAGLAQFASGMLDLRRQLCNILLFQPLFQLERSRSSLLGPEGASIFEGLDTHYLVLSALDHMMEATSLTDGSTAEDLLGFLAALAGRMRRDLDLATAKRVAEAVLDALDNKANKHRKFEEQYFDAVAVAMKPYSFRLVEFKPDNLDVYRYTATPEGYLVYLGMLDIDLKEAQELMQKMLALLIERGSFEAALQIAQRAKTLSLEYRQVINAKLRQVLRAPASVNWTREVDPQLDDARTHVKERQSEDSRMEESVANTLAETVEVRTRERLIQLKDAIKDANAIRLRLVTDITTAPEAFISAQNAAFRTRRPMGLPDLETVTFPALMRAPAAFLAAEADSFLSALYPPEGPRVFFLNDVLALLMDTRAEEIAPAPDEGELEMHEPPPDPFPKHLVVEVQGWLGAKLDSAAIWRVEQLLQLAHDEGLASVKQRCLVFLLYQAYGTETDFEGLTVRKDGDRFVLDFVQGDNLEFFKEAKP